VVGVCERAKINGRQSRVTAFVKKQTAHTRCLNQALGIYQSFQGSGTF